MELQVGGEGFLTIVTKSASGEVKYPLKAPTFRQIREYSKTPPAESLEGLEKLLLDIGLPTEIINNLSVIDINAIAEKMSDLISKKK